ncbi:hypothetical protein [Streptomyces sp. AK02-01A]|nr:hypothetical protein [Streptomyces sp. AK02-01A]MDX3852790.1 hypothetical protein [Streptomyces sp. AK02-01A]
MTRIRNGMAVATVTAVPIEAYAPASADGRLGGQGPGRARRLTEPGN